MSRRRKTSGGQAIVMVTLALIAMCGMMGLAVDLGWSFFVQKQAQAAADGAALGAVQEAYKRKNGLVSGLTCGVTATDAWCSATPVACGTGAGASPSNLYNGCLYATSNGFTAGGLSGRQNVTVQADVTHPAPTAPGVNDISYWATVRTFQTIPQLFSAVLGNSTGTIAARATAAIANEALPNSLYGEDREGDCADHANGTLCGVPLDFAAVGSITAQGGVVLDSLCNGTGQPGCGNSSGGSGSNYAGMGNGTVTAQEPIQIRGGAGGTRGGKVQNPGGYSPAPTPGPSDGSLYQDPTRGLTQPPIAATAPAPTCGILNGSIAGTTGNNAPLALGPYNYYSYHMQGNTKVPDGRLITLTGNVAFSNSGGGCWRSSGVAGALNSAGATPQSSSFPSYIFHGGLYVNDPINPSNTTVSFDQGQYVMDGRLYDSGWLNGVAPVFLVEQGLSATTTIQEGSNSVAGQMFIFTAPPSDNGNSYPGLNTQINAFPELQAATANTLTTSSNQFPGLWQGKTEMRPDSGSITLNGVNDASGALPASLSQYDGILFWQDRRNSTVKYNADGSYNCTPPPFTDPSCTKTPAQYKADRMIDDFESVEQEIGTKSAKISLNGVIYQPRGAILELCANCGTDLGGSGTFKSQVQIITGALTLQGNVNATLTIPTHPLKRLITTLIE
jgi:Flp pilus assembly protein TadG